MSRVVNTSRAAIIAGTILAGVWSAPVDAQAGPTIRQLVEVADLDELAASPDGRLVAFRLQRPSIAANSYRLDWYVADLSSGKVRRVAGGGAPIYTDGLIEGEPPVWSPDSRAFFTRAFVGGKIGLWRTSADGSGSRLIVGGPANVESLVVDPGGRSLSYVTGPVRSEIEAAEHREYDHGILIDPSIDPLQNPFRGGWVHGRLASQRLTGVWFSRAGLLWRNPRVRHQLDLATLRDHVAQTIIPVQPKPLTLSYRAPGPSAQSASGRVATIIGQNDDQHLETVDDNGRRVTCDASACLGHMAWVTWTPNGQELLFARQDRLFRYHLYLWDIRSRQVREVVSSEGQLSGGRATNSPCAVSASSVICVEAKAVSPPRLVRISLADGFISELFDPNSELRSRPTPTVEQLTYKLADGREATGTLLYRRGPLPRKAPLFAVYYLCPGYLRGATGDPFPLDQLADAGFVVACLNAMPLSERSTNLERERDGLASMTSLVSLLDSRGWVDAARVGMGGHSLGSQVVMRVAMTSGLLSAAAVVSPQVETTYYWLESGPGSHIPKELKDLEDLGPPDEDPAGWKLLSPAFNTDHIKTPVLMQLSEQEFRSGMELYSKLGKTTTPVEMYAFPDEAHVKVQPRHRFAVYRRNLDWFRFWLQDYVDPDPTLAAQYRRWIALRERQRSSAK